VLVNLSDLSAIFGHSRISANVFSFQRYLPNNLIAPAHLTKDTHELLKLEALFAPGAR
jgi:hypothetical protein